MAQRSEAYVNLLREAILRVLEQIGDGGQALWLTSPATVSRLPLFASTHADLPAIFVQCSDLKEDIRLAAELHECQSEWVFWILTRNAEDPDGELHRLAADVAAAMTGAEATLEALAVRGLDYLGYTYDAEASERLGLAVGKSRWRLTYRWTHANP